MAAFFTIYGIELPAWNSKAPYRNPPCRLWHESRSIDICIKEIFPAFPTSSKKAMASASNCNYGECQ